MHYHTGKVTERMQLRTPPYLRNKDGSSEKPASSCYLHCLKEKNFIEEMLRTFKELKGTLVLSIDTK